MTQEQKSNIPPTVDDIPEDLPGLWEATEEEQREIDEILADLDIDFE